MASAKQCDRCKKYFNHGTVKVKTERRIGLDVATSDLDLCPDCFRDFVKFMQMEDEVKSDKEDANSKSSNRPLSRFDIVDLWGEENDVYSIRARVFGGRKKRDKGFDSKED